MIKLSEKGVFLASNNEIIAEEHFTGEIKKEEAKKGTIAWSILSSHNTSGNMDKLKIKFDSLASHDITFVGIVQTAKASGMERFPLPYVLTNCHNSLCAVGGTINGDDHVFWFIGGSALWRYFCASAYCGHPSIYARDDGRRRQNDPRVRQPHPLRCIRDNGSR